MGSGDVVVRERSLDASPDEVWDLLTDASLLEEWLADEAEADVRPGGEVRLVMPDGEVRHGVFEDVEPGRSLSLWWWTESEAPRRVEFLVVPGAAATRLVVVETRGPAFAAGPSMSLLAARAAVVRA